MSRKEIAKILFQFHQQIWNDPTRVDKEWDRLEGKRDLYIYSLSKSEYYRMADGVRKKILNSTIIQNKQEFSKEEL